MSYINYEWNKIVKKLLFIFLTTFALMGCSSDDDDCTTGVSGCSSDEYSCPAAAFCYSTKSGCSASGEC